MSLSDKLKNYEPPAMGTKCMTCKMLAELPSEDRDAFNEALKDERISSAGLARIVREEGYVIGESAIRRHRKGDCKGL